MRDVLTISATSCFHPIHRISRRVSTTVRQSSFALLCLRRKFSTMVQRKRYFSPLPGGVVLAVHPEPQPTQPELGLLNNSGKQKIKKLHCPVPIVTLKENTRHSNTKLPDMPPKSGHKMKTMKRTNRKVPKIRWFQKLGRIDECPEPYPTAIACFNK